MIKRDSTRREIAAELRSGGLDPSAIAERLGVSQSTVYRWLNPVAWIGSRLGVSKGCLGAEMWLMRARGWDLPHRYRGRAA